MKTPEGHKTIAMVQKERNEMMVILKECVNFFENDPNLSRDGWMADTLRNARAILNKQSQDEIIVEQDLRESQIEKLIKATRFLVDYMDNRPGRTRLDWEATCNARAALAELEAK